MVSAADKNQNNVLDGLLSADGDRVFYGIYGGTDVSTTGSRAKFLATRTEAGWKTTNALPPQLAMLAGTYMIFATAPDLSGWIASAFDGVGGQDESPDASLIRLTSDGLQEPLHTFPTLFGQSGLEGVASADLSAVYATAPEAIDPSQRPGTYGLYEFGSGPPILVGRMPGTNRAPECGVNSESFEFASRETSSSLNWVSKDGSRVFFLSRGDAAPACTAPEQLYEYDRDADATTEISASPTGAGPDLGVDAFLQGAADGSWAYFETASSYEPADDADGNSSDGDVYRWSEGGGISCITCTVPNAEVLPVNYRTNIYTATASADGSHIYFLSRRQLADAPPSGPGEVLDLYVWSDDDVTFVARLSDERSIVTAMPGHGGDLTPDGNVLVFQSNQSELNTSTADNGGYFQYYRYDDRSGDIACLSCLPDGVPASAPVQVSLAESTLPVPPGLRVVTDGGDTVLFSTPESLVTDDVNAGVDLYEWHAGTVSLITDGVSHRSRATAPTLLTVSPDGRDVLFTDQARLTGDASDSAIKLYDARVGGGFLQPPAPAPTCSGDGACLGPVAPSPPALGAGSDGPGGAGNVAPKPHRHCKGNRRLVRHHGKSRCVSRHRHQGGAR
ncbi:MAG TPA: hypothetical protein VFJ57_00170 [Solirubrobacterales bacterium]|nr:hypothetical protein [Solirubrobacterales bacterium]